MVAGGYNSQNNKGMASTEFVKPGATSVSGNPMPGKRMYHCFVKYDDDNAMIGNNIFEAARPHFLTSIDSFSVGGHSDAYSYYDRFTTETFVYTISTQTWSSGPATDIGRTYHACGAGVDISTGLQSKLRGRNLTLKCGLFEETSISLLLEVTLILGRWLA